jgi:hypothetical protein
MRKVRLMATSAAGREYRMQDLADDRGGSERFWTCSTCGAVVGPRTAHRDLHDAWHAQHGDPVPPTATGSPGIARRIR